MVATRRNFLEAAAALAVSSSSALAHMLPRHQGPTAPDTAPSSGRSLFAGIRYDPYVYEVPLPVLVARSGDAAPEPLFRVGVATSRPEEALVPDVRDAFGAFDGAFQWSAIGSSAGGDEFDLCFAWNGPDTVCVGVPAPPGRLSPHWLTVQALGDAAAFALPAVIHTILATACVPGLIGVDFEDVRAAVTLGTCGVLALETGDPERAIRGAYGRLAANLGDRGADGEVVALINALLIPRAGGLGMRECRQMVAAACDPVAPWAQGLTDGCAILSAPLIKGGQFACAVLAITRPLKSLACL